MNSAMDLLFSLRSNGTEWLPRSTE